MSHLLDELVLPDANNRHVLAAAIQSGAQAIITFNLKDFPKETLSLYGIETIHPDAFIEYQLDLHQGAVITAANNTVNL